MWLVFIVLPVFFSFLQIVLLQTVFKYDTPVVLKQNGEIAKLNEFMKKIYHPHVVQERIDEIAGGGVDISHTDEVANIGYGAVCCGPQYSRATFVGCSLSIFQQMTGINVIMFYSNTIFKNAGVPATTVTGLVGIVNFVSTLIGMVFLGYFGRKTLMLVFNVLMALDLAGLGIFSLKGADYNN